MQVVRLIYIKCIKGRCPFIGRAFDDNWGLEDPTGKSDEEFRIVIKEIENRILLLKENISKGVTKNT